MIILATIHTESYQRLANLTWTNKILYAEKHNYDTIAKDCNFYGIQGGFEKIAFLLDTLETFDNCKYIFWSGTDSLITNFNNKLEDLFTGKDINLVCDFNFEINADVMLLKNSEITKKWLKEILDSYEIYKDHQFAEQQAMLDSLVNYRNDINIFPQRVMNSYDYSLYSGAPWNNTEAKDVYGKDGQWQVGDFLIHWPGTQMHERMILAEKYLKKVIGN